MAVTFAFADTFSPRTNVVAVTFAKCPVVALTLPASTLPVTSKLVKVPTLVIYGCAFVSTVPVKLIKLAIPVTVRLDVVKFAVAVIFSTANADPAPPLSITRPPTVAIPVTTRLPRLPTVVMFGCDAVCNVPVTFVNAPVVPLTLPVLTLPVTDSAVSVPTLVMCGCALVSAVPWT